ncbi:TetR/AcrR family transcriptional regulator C-terminal domain-containing protein [Streptomyces sp. XD-27]|uniref:TetR/AcrR family transcriptional regulator C-terminal domain-containing protein n=1 Tax=Streptomyces sp. XD-27 TaxID=3062779 RepID=UPI0026F4427A|nr:TetR/AcrR family transcriptional regulator C-terminal domain-containing protein [Streptomyces sp. XD-27]WKX70544.1 TetR/AcrR family transcriptional regulator C-terminal domain-containing protein [Streptomyces sp. XD-27]
MEADEQPITSVWTRRRRRRREQPALSRQQIVAEALRLLDTEGIDALSMRRLGTSLNAGATSMYSHVANKDELIELVVDEVYGEMAAPAPGDPAQWRAAARECAHSMRSGILRHPWVGSVLGGVGLAHLGPNMMRLTEDMLALFEAAGFSLDEADHAMNTLAAFVIGIATSEAAWLTTLARSGQDEQEWTETLRSAAEEAVRDHPRLRKVYAAQRGTRTERTREGRFAYGLERVLDGLETRLGGSSR